MKCILTRWISAILKGRSIITVKHKEKIPKYDKLDFEWYESKPLSTYIPLKKFLWMLKKTE